MNLAELTKAGLISSKILIQVYDGAFVMTRHVGGVQHLLQERENKDFLFELSQPSIAPCSGIRHRAVERGAKGIEYPDLGSFRGPALWSNATRIGFEFRPAQEISHRYEEQNQLVVEFDFQKNKKVTAS